MSQLEFSWRDDADAVVVRRQEPIAIYLNSDGAVVIRQEDQWNDDDPIIVVQCSNAQAVADALLAAARQAMEIQKAEAPEPVHLVQVAE